MEEDDTQYHGPALLHLTVSLVQTSVYCRAFMEQISPYLEHPPKIAPSLRSLRQWLGLLIGAVIGGFLGYMATEWLLTSTLAQQLAAMDFLGWLGLAATFLLLFWLSVLIHELGHLAFGAAAGLRPALLFAGPLQLHFGPDGVRATFNRVWSTWGGLALALPIGDQITRGQWLALVAGGPSSSLLLAVVAFGIGNVTSGFVALSCMQLVLLSGCIGIGTLIPMTSDGYASDGGQLLQLAQRRPEAMARLRLATVIGQNLGGTRPRDWNSTLLTDILAENRNPFIRTSTQLLLAQHADDSGDPKSAREAFAALARELHEGGLEAYPSAFRPNLLLTVATFVASDLGDAECAQAWLRDAGSGGVVEAHERLHAEAALAAARGDTATARLHAESALELLGKARNAGEIPYIRERLQALLARVGAHSSASSTTVP